MIFRGDGIELSEAEHQLVPADQLITYKELPAFNSRLDTVLAARLAEEFDRFDKIYFLSDDIEFALRHPLAGCPETTYLMEMSILLGGIAVSDKATPEV